MLITGRAGDCYCLLVRRGRRRLLTSHNALDSPLSPASTTKNDLALSAHRAKVENLCTRGAWGATGRQFGMAQFSYQAEIHCRPFLYLCSS